MTRVAGRLGSPMTGLIGVVLAVVVVVMILAAPAGAIAPYCPADPLTHIGDGAIQSHGPIYDPARSSWSGAGEAGSFVYDPTTTRAPERVGVLSAPDRDALATESTGVRTVADETGQVKPFKSFSKAKAELGTNPGEDIHHVVEQCQCKPTRSGFSTERVNTTDNLVRLDEGVHDQVSAYYSSKPPGFTSTVRDSLNGLPWQDQYDFGIDVVERALKGILR